MVKRIEQNTNVTPSPKSASNTNKAEKKIIIDFINLPKQLKTKEARKKYDIDGSGFLESSNKNGINELELMQPYANSIGVKDLNEYKSNISFIKKGTVNTLGGGTYPSVKLYDDKGKLISQRWLVQLENYEHTHVHINTNENTYVGKGYDQDYNLSIDINEGENYSNRNYYEDNNLYRSHNLSTNDNYKTFLVTDTRYNQDGTPSNIKKTFNDENNEDKPLQELQYNRTSKRVSGSLYSKDVEMNATLFETQGLKDGKDFKPTGNIFYYKTDADGHSYSLNPEYYKDLFTE